MKFLVFLIALFPLIVCSKPTVLGEFSRPMVLPAQVELKEYGLEIQPREGTALSAIASGTVAYRSDSSLLIDHGGGLFSSYTFFVIEGGFSVVHLDEVKRGQEITEKGFNYSEKVEFRVLKLKPVGASGKEHWPTSEVDFNALQNRAEKLDHHRLLFLLDLALVEFVASSNSATVKLACSASMSQSFQLRRDEVLRLLVPTSGSPCEVSGEVEPAVRFFGPRVLKPTQIVLDQASGVWSVVANSEGLVTRNTVLHSSNSLQRDTIAFLRRSETQDQALGKKGLDNENQKGQNALAETEGGNLNRLNIESTRRQQEDRVSEEKRLAEERKQAEERRLAEEKKLAEARRAEDERKKLEQAQLAEAKRIAEERRMAEERKLAEEKRLAEERKLAEARRAEQERIAKEAMQREQKLAAELREMKEQLQALQKNAPKPSVAVVGTRRLALVIGNDGYQSVPKLINARADARAMAKQLEATGFKVTLQFDLTERAMKDALRTFRTSVEGGDEVVVFFAGHGVQLGTANYLLPVDIRGDSEEQVKDEAIPLQRILDDLSDRKARFSLAIVDACRDNPFKTTGRSIGGRGLAPAAAASGQMVIFSAGTGQQALDRLGDKDKDPNGLFTRIFLKEMAKPGVPIDRVVRTVRNEVVQMAKSVGHEQVPALYDQTLGDFFFVR